MERVLIFGDTMFSKEMMNYILGHKGDYEIVGFTLDKNYIKQKKFCGFNVYPFEELNDYFDMSDVGIILAIGYHEMNDHREKVFNECKKRNYRIASYIDKSVINYAKEIGEGNIILDFVQLRHDCVIGNGNIIKGTSDIAHDAIVGDFNYFAGLCHIGGAVKIGNKNFLGISCIIKNEVEVGYKNVIGAAVYLPKDLDKFIVVSPSQNRYVQVNEKRVGMFL